MTIGSANDWLGYYRVVEAHSVSKRGGATFALAPQVLQEFVHVATDCRRFQYPLSFDEALNRSRFWWEADEITHCHPGEGAWEQAWTWMEEFHLGRKRILDAYLAATYYEKSVIRLAISNTRYSQLLGVFDFESGEQIRKEPTISRPTIR
jgi:hypothetical protein